MSIMMLWVKRQHFPMSTICWSSFTLDWLILDGTELVKSGELAPPKKRVIKTSKGKGVYKNS